MVFSLYSLTCEVKIVSEKNFGLNELGHFLRVRFGKGMCWTLKRTRNKCGFLFQGVLGRRKMISPHIGGIQECEGGSFAFEVQYRINESVPMQEKANPAAIHNEIVYPGSKAVFSATSFELAETYKIRRMMGGKSCQQCTIIRLAFKKERLGLPRNQMLVKVLRCLMSENTTRRQEISTIAPIFQELSLWHQDRVHLLRFSHTLCSSSALKVFQPSFKYRYLVLKNLNVRDTIIVVVLAVAESWWRIQTRPASWSLPITFLQGCSWAMRRYYCTQYTRSFVVWKSISGSIMVQRNLLTCNLYTLNLSEAVCFA